MAEGERSNLKVQHTRNRTELYIVEGQLCNIQSELHIANPNPNPNPSPSG